MIPHGSDDNSALGIRARGHVLPPPVPLFRIYEKEGRCTPERPYLELYGRGLAPDRMTIAIPQQKEGHDAALLASVAKGVLRHEKYLAS